MYHGEASSNVEGFTHAIEDCIQWYNAERIQQRLKGLELNQSNRRGQFLSL